MICWSLPLVILESILYERGRTVLMPYSKDLCCSLNYRKIYFYRNSAISMPESKFILTALDS